MLNALQNKHCIIARVSTHSDIHLDIYCLQAIDFVQMQQDDELWDLLIALALSQAPLTGLHCLVKSHIRLMTLYMWCTHAFLRRRLHHIDQS